MRIAYQLLELALLNHLEVVVPLPLDLAPLPLDLVQLPLDHHLQLLDHTQRPGSGEASTGTARKHPLARAPPRWPSARHKEAAQGPAVQALGEVGPGGDDGGVCV